MKLRGFIGTLFAALSAFSAELDSAGNGFLRGDYFVRQVIASEISTTIDIGQMRTLYGTMTFDGNGTYQFRGNLVDSRTAGGQAQSHTSSGRYKVGANGLAEIEALFGTPRETIFGAVGESTVVGSMTESEPQLHDVFIAIPAGAGVTNATVQGRYLGGTIDILEGQARTLRTALLSFTSDGRGALTAVSAVGQARNRGASTLTQSVDAATYNFSPSGAGAMNFPIPGGASAADQRLIGGDKVVYASADGGLLLGGGATGHDIFVAFKAPEVGSASLYNGTYVATSLLADPLDGLFWSNYGSTRTNGSGAAIAHERTNEALYLPYDFTYSVTVDIPANGISNRQGTRLAISNEGRHTVWTGTGSQFSFVFETRARSFSGMGVFLHPLGVTNAASFSPVTAAVAPGEFVTLFGSGLAGTSAVATLPFPTTFEGVQVLVNGEPISLYSVSPTQISGILPYSLPPNDYAMFTVIHNGRTSNVVTQYTSPTAPGVFTIPSTGLGVPAALHLDFSLVSKSSPAKAGEIVSVYLTGLGAVSPAVRAGAAAPLDPLSRIDASFVFASVGGFEAVVSYAGLAPGLAGLYQINITIPNGVEPGDAVLSINVPGSIASQTFLPVK